ncbi:tRNA (adenosine(37)-N6)-threonylcarbamoyltransferase complex transferase subunit TsaD [Paracrocinitomix mangrovi]|uniref:tRNA (adenosine(37)-N6)-threonylcarbamoyltransferase complex transferase subunit TsaD n=1 Tax=Paracrocinitomix mangrovi TaxID=2862509 RepID=UPI001C8E85CA|nr:tRNA (adenosine(37)-N6)-threonylcarbamoyltransferase complex transferase subunit TsaD [Paracrocinitomix mangrovi]UKN02626.1 tRNA (adenosine(37)-N6)-threonylcarbamoyltransferase complex transferase subunit TsaD [Paracrocinitomix mangrovi]
MAAEDIIILGIESSCDDTSAAILKNGKMLSNIVAGQKVHEEFGGVVPELASRAHQQNIIPVVDTAIKRAGIEKNQINAIAFTRGPGLLGSLLVGVSFAKSFGQALNVPLIDVNHMQAHILAHFIKTGANEIPQFPFICLTVSGGHTQIVLVKDYFDMEILGETLDDAAGEAFDKAAKLLGLPYPGGPLVDKYAKEGDPHRFEFPIASIKGYDYSFSGLKTALLYFLKKEVEQDPNFIEDNLNDICASFQHTIIKTLFNKLIKACNKYQINQVAIAGGVSANSLLRSELERIGKEKNWKTFIPPFEFCTDNAGMIAIAGYHKYLKHDFVGQETVPLARLKF